MSIMMKRYEFVFVLPGKLEKETLDEEKKKLRDLLTAHKATVKEEVDWGKKQLAYPIKHEQTGYYSIWTVETATTALREIIRIMNFQDSLLRYALLQI